MAMTRAEINAKSDKKRGVRLQSYKLHEEVIALLAELSSQTGLSKTQIVSEGIKLFAETNKVA
ncbi:ribbon-helix-helix protein, CopG family [Avibacterium paragallinarum]|uniref:Ribbon-helix-helix protein, CopG family n=1 Tax=Avibacterium paragallinarum TaxID=728 RepID=A0A8B3T643_AVIPA|nr:ribbon-helix-helix protein, CopG family [Avibacterium paragallinarum]RZN53531.1 ribbon-helix-helix protein, CopG family [Avibacterium paragallinarum]